MDTMEIGKQLVSFCQKGENLKAIENLYSPEIVSVEAMSMPGMPAEMHGTKAIKEKNQWWMENNTVNSSDVKGPFPMGDRFAVVFNYDITNKKTNERTKMEEVALYTTKNGKIVKEEFFYGQ
jgi:ketosteroid isomerase-like protein